MTTETKPVRKELLVSLSVVALISDKTCTKLLLVKDRSTGKWSPPAGGLNWLEEQNQMETFTEGLVREVQEETGVQISWGPWPILKAMVNLPGKDKNHVGAVFQFSADERQVRECSPQDTNEIEMAKFFTKEELVELLNQEDLINRPEFNIGLIVWWLRNDHQDNWDPYRGTNCSDRASDLNERYLTFCFKSRESIVSQLLYSTEPLLVEKYKD